MPDSNWLVGTPAQVIWATCHVRPIVFNLYLARCLPPPDADLSAEWKRVAEQSLPMLSDSDVSVVKRCGVRYLGVGRSLP